MRPGERRDVNQRRSEGGDWVDERRNPTTTDRIKDAARDAADKARRVFAPREGRD